MFSLRLLLTAMLAALPLCPDPAHADEDEIWNSRITQDWLDSHLAASRRTAAARDAFALARMQVWTNGLSASAMQPFATSPSDRTVGAKLRPFRDFPLTIGTELSRAGTALAPVSSRLAWETSWRRDWERLGGLTVALATGGSLGNLRTGYTQSLSGTLGIPVGSFVERWDTQFRLVPTMSLDTLSGTVGSNLTSEIVTRRVLGSPLGEYRSVLNLKLGYSLAPDTHPAAFAGLEIRISPNL